jgi:hypothetical protein
MVTDKAKRLKVLRLGSKEPLIGLGTPPTEGAEESAARRWAARLKSMIDMRRPAVRSSKVSVFRFYPDFIQDHPTLLEDYPELANGCMDYPGFGLEAAQLPVFSRTSRSAWWAVAKKLFHAITGKEPWRIPDLAKLATSDRSNQENARPGQKLDGNRRSDIEKAIRQAFLRLAVAA